MRQIKRKIKAARERRLEKQFGQCLAKLYHWWDYSSLYKIMYRWLVDASKNYSANACSARANQVSEQMAVAAEYCRIISSDFDKDRRFIDTDEKQEALHALMKILDENSLDWWD